jgi:hypothetical protein
MKNTSIRVDDDVWQWLTVQPGRTVNDKLRGLMVAPQPASGPDVRLDEILEHVRSIAAVMPNETIPDSEQMEMIVDLAMQRKIDERAAARTCGPTAHAFDPRSVPGIQTGTGNLRPRRETGAERAQREGLERQDRARAMDSTDDPSIDRSDDFVSA